MKSFLEETTDYILKHHGDETADICLVAPNRRAGLFFRKHVSKKVNRVIWAPETLSIEDFLNRLSGLNVIDPTSLLFHFYEVYLRLEKDKAKPIDDFSRWAPVLLADMDEIDANLDDPADIYNALSDIKRIETWNPDGSPLTTFQQNYLAFFDNLEQWHRALVAHLLEKGLASQGQSSRHAARLVADEGFSIPWKKVIFTGFNALNQCEERVISTLLRRKAAVFLTDGDPYYCDDPGHEAGLFIRQTIRRLGLPKPAFSDHFREGSKNIHLLGIAKNVNQARLAGNILLQRPRMSRDDQTAIVLASENLLIPVLNALPADVEKVNVTMGYPLTKTNMYGYFDALWRLHLQRAKSGYQPDGAAPAFYHKDLIRFFSHSCTGLLWDLHDGAEKAASLVQQIRKANRSFFTFEELCGLGEDENLFRESFRFLGDDPVVDVSMMTSAMLTMVIRFDTLFREKAASHGRDIVNTPYFVDFEALYFLAGLLRRLQGFMSAHTFLKSYQTVYSLFRQLSDATRLSFAGEPLAGLQVMGMLETRNLDFENVILLSANENIIPRPKSNTSFIPFDVKKKFGLHVHTEKDAIFAYHFYRLLQRATNIYLVYNTQSEDIGSSEKSRFLTQLQMELRRYAPGVNITEHIVSLPAPQPPSDYEPLVPKTPDILERLHQLCRTGLSPSALNTFINCPLQFYFNRVVGIEETEDVEETIEATTMGTVVHAVLESLFKPCIGKRVDAAGYEEMIRQTESLTRHHFSQQYRGGDITSGKNLLLFNLSKRYVENYIRSEKRRLEDATIAGQPPATIEALEQQMNASVTVDDGGENTRVVQVKGLADRIDKLGNVVRIIDYKTGKLKTNELKFDEWELVGSDSQLGKAFQLLTYAWLYRETNPSVVALEPGIISMREAKKGLQTLEHPGGDGVLTPAHITLFGERLKSTISQMLDPALPFARTTVTDNCRYCPFKVFCRRV